MAGTWVEHSCLVPANPYLYLPSSSTTAVPVGYVAGQVKYKVFIPDAAALATYGLTGQAYRVLLVMPPNGTGDFASFTSGAQIARNLGASSMGVGLKLGYGFNDDGSLQTANTTWPYLTVFPQFTTDWSTTDPTGPGSGLRKQRAWDMIVDAVINDVNSRYTINRLKTCLTSVSSGGTGAFCYLSGRAMQKPGYTWDFASAIICASWMGIAMRGHFPGVGTTTENVDTVTAPRYAALLKNYNVSLYLVVSEGDTTIAPATYASTNNNLLAQYAASGPVTIAGATPRDEWRAANDKLVILEYNTGGGTAPPNHGNDWDWAYGNNVQSGAMVFTDPMWAWMDGQSADPRFFPTGNANATWFARQSLLTTTRRRR